MADAGPHTHPPPHLSSKHKILPLPLVWHLFQANIIRISLLVSNFNIFTSATKNSFYLPGSSNSVTRLAPRLILMPETYNRYKNSLDILEVFGKYYLHTPYNAFILLKFWTNLAWEFWRKSLYRRAFPSVVDCLKGSYQQKTNIHFNQLCSQTPKKCQKLSGDIHNYTEDNLLTWLRAIVQKFVRLWRTSEEGFIQSCIWAIQPNKGQWSQWTQLKVMMVAMQYGFPLFTSQRPSLGGQTTIVCLFLGTQSSA